MKTPFFRRLSNGFALMALMACMVVILIVFASVMYWITSNAMQMKKNQTFTSSEAAAEAASELIFAHMDRDYLYGTLNPASYYQGLISSSAGMGWPVTYTFNCSVTMGTPITNLEYLGSEYTNLLGEPQTNTVTVTATPEGQTYNVPSTVSQTFVFATIPAFQFAIFYNINLEIDPGDTMPVQGAVFSNGGIWSGTPNVSYSSTVEAAGQVSTNADDPFCADKSDSGTPRANFEYASSPPQPESDVNPLVIPIGASSSTNDTSTNVIAIIQIPPASVCAPLSVAYQPTNQTYDFNAACLIISNAYYGTNGPNGPMPFSNNFTAYLQDNLLTPTALPNWTQLTNDYYIYSNNPSGKLYPTNYVPTFHFTNNLAGISWTNSTGTNYLRYASFSFLTNVAFYDFREKATVQAVQIDMGKLGLWITNNYLNGGSNWNQLLCDDVNHGINSAYVYNAVPFIGQEQLPAVRVVNGALLPSSTCVGPGGKVFTCGFSVATAQPLYVKGNYNVETNGASAATLGSRNTANTYPAAFLADAITCLSSNWVDTNASAASESYTVRVPVATTVNAACLEGIVPSAGSVYSGGVENFLRLLENWSGYTNTYNGSIMVMFTSEYATNQQQPTGNYYNAPVRVWGFDTNFLIQADLPPLTPHFTAVIRNSWGDY